MDCLLHPFCTNIQVPAVTKTLPNYLRVHRGPDRQPSPGTARPTADCIEQFWRDFSCTTGWRLDRRAARRGQTVQVLPAVSSAAVGSVLENSRSEAVPAETGTNQHSRPAAE